MSPENFLSKAIKRTRDDREVLRVAKGRLVFVPPPEEITQRMAQNKPFFDPIDASAIEIR